MKFPQAVRLLTKGDAQKLKNVMELIEVKVVADDHDAADAWEDSLT